MRRLLGSTVLGGTAVLTLALAGCHGVKVQLSPPSSSGAEAGSGGSSSAVQAACPVSGDSGALRVLAADYAGGTPY